jgi:hypothetical protein
MSEKEKLFVSVSAVSVRIRSVFIPKSPSSAARRPRLLHLPAARAGDASSTATRQPHTGGRRHLRGRHLCLAPPQPLPVPPGSSSPHQRLLRGMDADLDAKETVAEVDLVEEELDLATPELDSTMSELDFSSATSPGTICGHLQVLLRLCSPPPLPFPTLSTPPPNAPTPTPPLPPAAGRCCRGPHPRENPGKWVGR